MMIIMILMMILHMNDNKVMLIEILSFLMMYLFISYVSEVFTVFKVFVLPEFDVWDVMYSGMLYIWWNTVLINVLRSSGSSLCDFIHPLHSPLSHGKPQTLSWPGPSTNGWSYPSVTGVQLHTTVLHIHHWRLYDNNGL